MALLLINIKTDVTKIIYKVILPKLLRIRYIPAMAASVKSGSKKSTNKLFVRIAILK